MRVLNVSNVHEALPKAIKLAVQEGQRRDSRNGPVFVMPTPVTTVYEHPVERVLFWPERDANPFFHLYESLWMLAGRNDVAGPARYAQNITTYSDDGKTIHDAYGYRWRKHFQEAHTGIRDTTLDAYTYYEPIDQLKLIAEALQKNKDDRRCVLGMWDPIKDLGKTGKAFPCNLTVTFQRDVDGRLDMTVFNRSNDIIWGCYGANAVHFSFLQEYMAHWIDCPVGRYYQISVNWHAYENDELKKVLPLINAVDHAGYMSNPYRQKEVYAMSFVGTIDVVDLHIKDLLRCSDTGYWVREVNDDLPWSDMMYRVLRAHHIYKTRVGAARFDEAIDSLRAYPGCDWIEAAKQWLKRRRDKWQQRQLQTGELSHP